MLMKEFHSIIFIEHLLYFGYHSRFEGIALSIPNHCNVVEAFLCKFLIVPKWW